MINYENIKSLSPEDGYSVPVSVARYAGLIRAETELAILEAAVDELASYEAANVLKAVRTARSKQMDVLVAQFPKESEDETVA